MNQESIIRRELSNVFCLKATDSEGITKAWWNPKQVYAVANREEGFWANLFSAGNVYVVSVYFFDREKGKYESILINRYDNENKCREKVDAVFWNLSGIRPGRFIYDNFSGILTQSEAIDKLTSCFKTIESPRCDYCLEKHDIVYRRMSFGPYDHAGIYMGNNKVVHIVKNSNDVWYVREQSLSQFRNGENEIKFCRLLIPFYHPGKVNEKIIMKLDTVWNYDYKDNNCEHFATECLMEVNHSFQRPEFSR